MLENCSRLYNLKYKSIINCFSKINLKKYLPKYAVQYIQKCFSSLRFINKIFLKLRSQIKD